MLTMSKRWMIVSVIGQGVLFSLALTGFVRIGFRLYGQTLSATAADRLFVVSSLITGALCATLYGVTQRQAKAKSNATTPNRDLQRSDGDSVLRIARPVSYQDRCRSYQILVDGRKMARLKAGETVEILVPSGEHSIIAKIDWCMSPTLNCTTRRGETVELECASNLRGARILLSLFYIVFLRKQYLTLNRV